MSAGSEHDTLDRAESIRAAAERVHARAQLVLSRCEAQAGQIRHFLAGPEMTEYGFMTADGVCHWRGVGDAAIYTSRAWANEAVARIAHAQLISRTWTASLHDVVSS